MIMMEAMIKEARGATARVQTVAMPHMAMNPVMVFTTDVTQSLVLPLR